jgi:hypothetical protein
MKPPLVYAAFMDIFGTIIVALAGLLVWRAEVQIERIQRLLDRTAERNLQQEPTPARPVLVWKNPRQP